MRFWISCLAVAGLMTAAPAFADTGYLTVSGSKTGDIKGEVTAKGKENQHEVVDFELGVSSAAVTGRRVQQPVKFTLRWGKGTPVLFNSAVTGETLTQVRFFRWVNNTNAAIPGATVQSDEVELSNAVITSLKVLDRTGGTDGLEPLVEVTMSYQTLTITHKTGGITASDSWAK